MASLAFPQRLLDDLSEQVHSLKEGAGRANESITNSLSQALKLRVVCSPLQEDTEPWISIELSYVMLEQCRIYR